MQLRSNQSINFLFNSYKIYMTTIVTPVKTQVDEIDQIETPSIITEGF